VVAYHEAGHAVAAVILGGEVIRVSLESEQDDDLPLRDGDVAIRWHHRGLSRRDLVEREITVSLAGPAAEMIYQGERPHPATMSQWRADWEVAWSLAGEIFSDPQRRMAALEALCVALCQLLDDPAHWQAIAETADRLEAFETLEGDEVEEIVRRWI
jgi:hypothetical protein